MKKETKWYDYANVYPHIKEALDDFKSEYPDARRMYVEISFYWSEELQDHFLGSAILSPEQAGGGNSPSFPITNAADLEVEHIIEFADANGAVSFEMSPADLAHHKEKQLAGIRRYQERKRLLKYAEEKMREEAAAKEEANKQG